ncbi:alanine racemase [Fusibacter paucivorans]|uniref:Alanine racemase n=1 Tax=Fusibacter paucivorans TaxID=76009 RepID=A0ABS5PSH2_9FIRM|nr:alanine racemase [Fusibacter paucivorans]MBS7527012.1 alanine racemase [Fusibacter paucivorans]
MAYEYRPAWMEIDLGALAHNYKQLADLYGGTKICAVVKADAYGHGMIPVAKKLHALGVDFFAVATIIEAQTLRAALPDVDILILGYSPIEAADVLIEKNLIQTLYDVEQGKAFHLAGLKHDRPLRVHVKVDTGMRRLGFSANAAGVNAIENLHGLKGLAVEGIYSHFARADEIDASAVHAQGQLFIAVLEALSIRGVTFKLRHICNSAASARFPEYYFDMVRPGIVLYGQPPSEAVALEALELREVMCVKANIAMVKSVDKGDGVSYGHRYHLPETMNIATIPVGYADGLLRGLSGKAHVLVDGEPCPIIGSICMDQCMVAVGEKTPKMGDEVVVLGGNVHPMVSVAAYAKALGTISYEITCQFSLRLHRQYTE